LLLDGFLGSHFESEAERAAYLQTVGEEFADLVLRRSSPSQGGRAGTR